MGPGRVRRVRGRGGGRVWGDSQFLRAISGGMDAAAPHKPMFQTASNCDSSGGSYGGRVVCYKGRWASENL
jgi:hypothetical protein